ncbi:MAG: lactonase family protein [Ilumatobacteraceae bacterium]
MKRTNPSGRRVRAGLAVGVGAVVALSSATAVDAAAPASRGHDGQVYAISNDPAGNALLVFNRSEDGSLTAAAPIPTGGTGTGMGLGSQGSVVVSGDGRYVLAVNPGSDQVSLFAEVGNELVLVDTEASGGDLPTSVTVDGRNVYVLNTGVGNNISGFRISRDGLDSVAGSIQPLSQEGAAAAQVSFTPDGNHVVVTERNTNRIDTFRVKRRGAEPAVVNQSTGVTPFGFDFGRSGELLVSNANGGAPGGSSVSSYTVGRDGVLTPIDGPDPTFQTSACWLAVAGRNAFTANTGSGTLTGFGVDGRGRTELLEADGISATVGTTPIDLDTTDDEEYLYQLNGADDSIGVFAVSRDGDLTNLGFVTGLPATAVGLAAQ